VSDVVSLAGLEMQLCSLSHSDEAMRLVQNFSASLKKTLARQDVFNAPGALVCSPISYKDVLAKGLIDPKEDAFSLLQGDVVKFWETPLNLMASYKSS
jgi:hypothetical protein